MIRDYRNKPAHELIQTYWYRIFVLEAYINAGMNKLGILRYSVFGFFMADFQGGFIYMVVYAFASYIIGRTMYKKGLIYIQAEVGNQFNKFQQELRQKVKMTEI